MFILSSRALRAAPRVHSSPFLKVAVCCAALPLASSVSRVALSASGEATMAAAAGAVHMPRIRKGSNGTLVVEPHDPKEHTATVIMMHGLGDTSEGWIDVAAGVFAQQLPHVKFILPTASTLPVTINGGFPMPAWYDIRSLSAHRELESCDGIHASRDVVLKIMADEEEKHKIAPGRMVLAGFSQGGAMSLFVGLNHPQTLAGLLCMSGYMPLPAEVKPKPAALETPVLQCHGDADGVVPLAYGKDAHERMAGLGVKSAEFKVYKGLAHSANDKELEDALAFLKRVLV